MKGTCTSMDDQSWLESCRHDDPQAIANAMVWVGSAGKLKAESTVDFRDLSTYIDLSPVDRWRSCIEAGALFSEAFKDFAIFIYRVYQDQFFMITDNTSPKM